MKVRIDDNDPCRYVVSSESDSGKEYVVDLCRYPLGKDAEGNLIFNGACVATQGDCKHEGEHVMGCRDFVFRCEPLLRRERNVGKAFRCKHCRAARDYALTCLLPYLAKNRPNVREEELP